jgi:virginiamycin B lyase
MDLPHDIAVAADGAVLATGMFTHRIYRIDPESGRIDLVPIPVEKANPRAIEVDRAGRWWVLLGAPKRVARHDPASGRWEDWPIGLYPHSIAVSDDGASVWFNGHFTRDPERIGRLAVATGAVDSFDLPRHPGLAAAGGPLPYELRLGPDGTVWMSELQGNRIVSLDPASGATRAYTLPTAWSGPRRFDVDRSGVLWIPEYAASRLARFDPRTERFEEFALPIRDALPYVARVHPASGEVWIGTAAADAVLRFDPRRRRFDVFPLPTRGATVRHLAIDPVRGDVWMAYGASPAIHPPRVARLRPR